MRFPRLHSLLALPLAGASLCVNLSAATVIQEDFNAAASAYGNIMTSYPTPGGQGLAPLGVNLPGGTWKLAGGGVFDSTEFPTTNSSLPGVSHAAGHNGGAVALTMGTHNAGTTITVQASLAFHVPAGSGATAGYALVGFYNAPKTSEYQSDLAGFSGLRLNYDGGLQLVINGTASGGAVAFGGSFNPATFRTLTFSVNTTSGAISAVSLGGSSAGYSFPTSGFTAAATAYVGLGGNMGNNPAVAVFDSLTVSTGSASPTPTPTPSPTPSGETDVVSDDFSTTTSAYGQTVTSTTVGGTGLAPSEVNLPGGTWKLAGGGIWDSLEYAATNAYEPGISYATGHNGGAAAIALGTHNQSTDLTVRARFRFALMSGSTVTNGYALVGFWNTPKTGEYQSALSGFSGLRVNQNGSLQLVINGSNVGSAVSYGGNYSATAYTTLTFTVNTTSGAISGVTFGGSTAGYSFSTGGFTVAATAYAGFGGSLGNESSAVVYDTFRVSKTGAPSPTPTPTPTPSPGATDIVRDGFSATAAQYGEPLTNSTTVGGTGLAPSEVNLPGGTWKLAGGGIYDSYEYAASNPYLPGVSYATGHNGGAAAITLGSYNLSRSLTVSSSFKFAIAEGSGANSGYALVGFYNAPKTAQYQSELAGFSGLRVNLNGSLQVVISGTASGSAVAYGGTFDPAAFQTLTYTVNTNDGSISAVSYGGSNAVYPFSTGGFTNTATAYAGIGGTLGNNSSAVAFDTFAVSTSGTANPTPTPIPTPAPGVPGAFGAATSAASYSSYGGFFPKLDLIGTRTVRMFAFWESMEPTQGSWNFTSGDALVASAASNHITLSGMLGFPPSWAAATSLTFPMSQLTAWSNYVSTVVNRYKSSVKYWEVWNEPDGAFNHGSHTAADYANLVKHASVAAKSVDADAKVGLSVTELNAGYIDQVSRWLVANGAAGGFDFVCVHPYSLLNMVRERNGEAGYLGMVKSLRQLLAAGNPGRTNVPIFITEIGEPVGYVINGTVVTEATQANALVKAYVMAFAQGIQTTCWYEAKDSGDGFGLMRGDLSTRPSYTALQAMAALLGTVPQYQGWLTLNSDATGFGFVFQGTSSAVLVAWMPAGRAGTTTFPVAVQVTDPKTNATTTLAAGQTLNLTDSAVLVSGLPSSLVTQAQANAAQPFPWGGNYAAASAVSIDLGPNNASNGVEQRHVSNTVPHTFSDGTTGQKMNAPGVSGGTDINFAVHPSFASATQKTFYVRVTARRLTTNVNYAGMNFFYQAYDPALWNPYVAASGGWWSLPNDLNWHTKTWQITNACFTRMWGYDFFFRVDGSDPFVIGKVEVSTSPLP